MCARAHTHKVYLYTDYLLKNFCKTFDTIAFIYKYYSKKVFKILFWFRKYAFIADVKKLLEHK